jgi:hypothetical protein
MSSITAWLVTSKKRVSPSAAKELNMSKYFWEIFHTALKNRALNAPLEDPISFVIIKYSHRILYPVCSYRHRIVM